MAAEKREEWASRSPPAFLGGAVSKQREKVVSSNSCFPKWSWPCRSQSEAARGGSHSSVGWSRRRAALPADDSLHPVLSHHHRFFCRWFIVAFLWWQLYLDSQRFPQREPPDVCLVGRLSVKLVALDYHWCDKQSSLGHLCHKSFFMRVVFCFNNRGIAHETTCQ